LVTCIFLSLIVGFTWFQIDFESKDSVQDVPGFVYFLTTFIFISTILQHIIIVPNESVVILRDYLSGLYPVPVFYLSVSCYYAIQVIIIHSITFHIMFFCAFSNAVEEFNLNYVYPRMYGTYVVIMLVGNGLGMMISSIASSYMLAVSASNPINAVALLFGGFLIPSSQIPDVFKIFQYLSPWFYSIELNLNYIYRDMPAVCNFTGVQPKHMDGLKKEVQAKTPDEIKIRDLMQSMCYPSPSCDNYQPGNAILDHYSLEKRYATDFLILMGLILATHTIGIIILSVKMYRKTKNG